MGRRSIVWFAGAVALVAYSAAFAVALAVAVVLKIEAIFGVDVESHWLDDHLGLVTLAIVPLLVSLAVVVFDVARPWRAGTVARRGSPREGRDGGNPAAPRTRTGIRIEGHDSWT